MQLNGKVANEKKMRRCGTVRQLEKRVKMKRI